MTEFDPTLLLNKITPKKDAEPKVGLRTATVNAVNGNGTVNIVLDGVILTGRPVVGSAVVFSVGQVVNVLTGLGTLLVLGGTASSGATSGLPNAQIIWGTPSIPNTTLTALTPGSVPLNTGGMWTSGTNFTIPSGQGGTYSMGLSLRFTAQGTGTGYRVGRFYLNGVELAANVNTASGLNGVESSVTATTRAVLAAGDVITFRTQQTSGGALSLLVNGSGWLQRQG
jgi:hypothetical protein